MSMDYGVFDSLQISVVVIDSKFGVYYGNHFASLLFDVSVNRLKNGKSLAELITFKSEFCRQDELPHDGFSPMREVEFFTTNIKSGSLQINLQVDSTSTHLDEKDKRWIIYLRDVSLEKILHQKYMAELDQKEDVIKDLKAAKVQLEDYSMNLELKVEARTTELKNSNRLLAAILDSLDQGIIVFERTGFILPFQSKTSRKIFKSKIENKNLVNLLSKKESVKKQIREWLSVVFEETLDFEDSKGLGPTVLSSEITDKEIALSYNPMRDAHGKLQAVVMVATDKTDEMNAKREADQERALVKRLVQITKYRSQFRSFAQDARTILSRMIEAIFQSKAKHETLLVEKIAIDLHTFKGGAATFALSEMATEAHYAEELLVEYTNASSEMRISDLLLASLTKIQREFEAFLLANKDLYGGQLTHGLSQIEVSSEVALNWLSELEGIEEAKEVYIEIENLFLREEIGTYFSYLDESLSELAKSLGKKMKPLVITNGKLRIDAFHYRELFASLIHIFRNAIDHGLESPEQRKLKNKSEDGQVEIQFQLFEVAKDKKIRIVISDDGAGIDPKKIRDRMLKEKSPSAQFGQSEQDLIQIIFEKEFSSSDIVSEVSGRGIGLAAVKNIVDKMGGSIRVTSTPGHTTEFIIEVPFLVNVAHSSKNLAA